MQRRVKVKRTIPKVILLPSLCSMSFYIGIHLVGETEASFSSQVSSEPIEIAAAFVFPETIKQLNDHADKIANQMFHDYERLIGVPMDESLKELHNRMNEIRAIEQELRQQFNNLQHVHNELSAYYNEIKTQGAVEIRKYDFVSDGFRKVDNKLKEVQESIDFQTIETMLSSITLQIEQKQKDTSQEDAELQEDETPNQDAASDLNKNKQVIKYDQESITDSE